MFEMFVGAKFKFMEKRRIAYVISAILIAASAVSLLMHGGPRESIDFTGGSLLYVSFDRAVDVADVRSAASSAGFDGDVQMAENGTQAIIHFRIAEGDTTSQYGKLSTTIGALNDPPVMNLMSQETVGPKIGKELERKAAMAIFWSLIMILGYVAWRFTRVSFGLGAVIALFHDIMITVGIFSVLDIEVGLTVVAAFLTIGGYSINDTIVVYDRIRENMGLARRMTFQEIVNKSINQTLSRTVLTSSTTLLAVLSLYFLGGIVIKDFALAMLIGVLIGTYSSIFVASSLALDFSLWWNRRKEARSGGKPAAKAAAAR